MDDQGTSTSMSHRRMRMVHPQITGWEHGELETGFEHVAPRPHTPPHTWLRKWRSPSLLYDTDRAWAACSQAARQGCGAGGGSGTEGVHAVKQHGKDGRGCGAEGVHAAEQRGKDSRGCRAEGMRAAKQHGKDGRGCGDPGAPRQMMQAGLGCACNQAASTSPLAV